MNTHDFMFNLTHPRLHGTCHNKMKVLYHRDVLFPTHVGVIHSLKK